MNAFDVFMLKRRVLPVDAEVVSGLDSSDVDCVLLEPGIGIRSNRFCK